MQNTDTPPANALPTTLAQLEYGDFQHRASEALAELVADVHKSGRSGSMTIALKISPAGTRGQVKIESDLKLKLPAPEKGESLFFATEHGQLLRSDPRQRSFNFGEADDAEPERVEPTKASNQ